MRRKFEDPVPQPSEKPSDSFIEQEFEKHKRSRAMEAPSWGMAKDLFNEGVKFGIAFSKGEVTEPTPEKEDEPTDS